jgi:hypothetical protein
MIPDSTSVSSVTSETPFEGVLACWRLIIAAGLTSVTSALTGARDEVLSKDAVVSEVTEVVGEDGEK